MSKQWIEAEFKDVRRVVGIDEAGRGPLAGPCVVAGVVLPFAYQNDMIDDSKRLSEKKRHEVFQQILIDAQWVMIVTVSPSTIDRDNIYRSTQQAMRFIGHHAKAELVLTDAMPFTLEHVPVLDYVKGDQKSISIAAASIVAKVVRDDVMNLYDRLYPDYNFKQHKGYPTKAHIKALQQFGVTPIHRTSFSPVSEFVQIKLFD